MLGLNGWFSTNILGNRDGEVLDDPGSFKTKEESQARRARIHPAARPLSRSLQERSTTRCASTTTRRAATTKKAGTTSTSSAGSAIPMQIKVDFLCRDSILAAPIVLDLALFFDLAQRAGMRGIQEWLSFYFKSPMCAPRALPRARSLHPADEAEEHAALDDGRGPDHPPRRRILRLEHRHLGGVFLNGGCSPIHA